jgi:Arc/MetJ-type ribon-helix-helix transcriptional regulator
MAMTLSHDLEEQIKEIMSRGDYADAEDVLGLGHALSLLAEEERVTRLHAALDESQADIEAGRVSRLTPDLVADINAEAEEMFRSGVVPDPNVAF